MADRRPSWSAGGGPGAQLRVVVTGLGTPGAIEALATVLALRDGFVPPTVNLEEADPDCDLDFVPFRSRSAALRFAASKSYGFGGNNTALRLGRG